MTQTRLGTLLLAALLGSALAIALPELFARAFVLEGVSSSTLNTDLLWLAPAMALAVAAVAAFSLGMSPRSFRGDAPAEVRAAARLAAHRFPSRAAGALLLAGLAATAAATVAQLSRGHLSRAQVGAMAMTTALAVCLCTLALFLSARSMLSPLLAHLPEDPLEVRSVLGVRGTIALSLLAVALASLIPAPLLLEARLDPAADKARRRRAWETAEAVARLVEAVEPEVARSLVGGATVGEGVALLLRTPSQGLIPAARTPRIAGQSYVEADVGGVPDVSAVRVAYSRPAPQRGRVLPLVFVSLLLVLAVATAASVARLFAADVTALGLQVGTLAGSDGSRLDAPGAVEVARVGAAINALLDRVARQHVDSFLAVEKLEEARRTKSQFLANMSHDLRSPLNSILGFSELLLRGLDGELADEDRAPLAAIQRAGRGLLRMINEILDTAKCESGKMIPVQQAMAPVELATLAMQELRRGPEVAPEIELVVEVEPGLDPVEVDPVLMPQAVAHTLVHAAAAVRQGRVVLHVGERKVGRTRHLLIEVSYPGDPPEGERDQLFLGFRRVAPGDLGLALPLARRLVELHGGTLVFAEGAEARLVLSVPAAVHRDRLGVLRRRSSASMRSV